MAPVKNTPWYRSHIDGWQILPFQETAGQMEENGKQAWDQRPGSQGSQRRTGLEVVRCCWRAKRVAAMHFDAAQVPFSDVSMPDLGLMYIGILSFTM